MSIFKVQCGYPQKTWHYPPVLINEIRHSRISTLLCSGLETRGPSFAITYFYDFDLFDFCLTIIYSIFPVFLLFLQILYIYSLNCYCCEYIVKQHRIFDRPPCFLGFVLLSLAFLIIYTRLLTGRLGHLKFQNPS